MNIYYDNKLLLALYSYLRQTELSIDRGLNEWKNARSYLKHRYLADKLIMALAINKTLHQKNTFSKVYCYAYLKLRHKQYLTQQESDTICCLLRTIGSYLSEDSPDRSNLIKLRIELYNAAKLVRKRITNNNRIILADRVEHYNQHLHGTFYSIEEITSL